MTTTPTVWKSVSQLNPNGTGSQSDAAIIDIGLGRYVAVWTEAAGGPIAIDSMYGGSDLVGQIFDAEGNAVGGEFQVNWTRYADDEQDVALAPRVGGGFAAVYEDTDVNGTGIVIDFFDVDGNRLSGFDVTADPGADTLANPSIAMNANGDYLITYERSNNLGDTDIVGVTISSAGTKSAEITLYNSSDDTTNPEVAALSNGNFVVVFDDEYNGDASNSDAAFGIFTPAGGSVTLTSAAATPSLENDAHVAALAGGGFVVVWRDDDGDGAGDAGIMARVYDNAGDPHADGVFSVNTTTAGNQSDPEVAALADGGFVVVWTDIGSGVIRGQRFDFIGDKVGSEFTQSAGVEDDPVVAGLSDGRFIVGSEDVDDAPTDIDLDATIFDPRTSPIDGDGNDNVITSRKDGATVNGLGGSDTLLGQDAVDGLFGDDGNDLLFGRSGVDFLYGGANEDVLDGGSGADLMFGGDGDDRYSVDNAGDVVVENADEGDDAIFSEVSYTLPQNVESLILSGAAADGAGNGLANYILGNAGNNRIDGKGGADIMQGREGDDIYVVDNAGDAVAENAGEGTDLVLSMISYALGANVENLGLAGSANIAGTGNGLANMIVGNAGNNALSGGGGNDTLSGGLGADNMSGGTGDDAYFVDNAGDVVNESAGEGSDTVVSTISYALGDNLENLVLDGAAKINGTGNDLANILVGNAGRNTLDGGKGADIISGGLGKDKLFGRGSKDTFVFTDPVEAGNADALKDFKHRKDKIFLDEDLFGALGPTVSKKEISYGKKAGDKNDHLIVNKGKIYYDADGKGGAKQVLIAKAGKSVKLDHKDFLIGDPDLLVA